MKKNSNINVIIGVVVLVVLIIMAMVLIVKRELPQEEKSHFSLEKIQKDEEVTLQNKGDAILQENAAINDSLQLGVVSANAVDEPKDLELADAISSEAIDKLGLEKYADSTEVYYSAPKYAKYEGEDMWQLEELFGYWDAYKLDAVADLVRLPRVRTAFTNELKGTNQFYYYGGLNNKGLPEGRGVAVYENNTYYCGDFKNGKRHGNGMWLQVFPDKLGTINGIPGIIEHSYNGEWKNDLPNGKGQEHFNFDLEAMQNWEVIANVVGTFEDGYYGADLYVVTLQKDGVFSNWEASANRGVFEYFHDRYNTEGKLPVWERMEKREEGTNYMWMEEEKNINWGISGLKKMD